MQPTEILRQMLPVEVLRVAATLLERSASSPDNDSRHDAITLDENDAGAIGASRTTTMSVAMNACAARLRDAAMAIEEDAQHQARIEELARLLCDDRLDEARPMLDELAKLLGDSDSRIVSARWELHFADTGHSQVVGDAPTTCTTCSSNQSR